MEINNISSILRSANLMEYQKLTIKAVMTAISMRLMLLPPIQRKFVWTNKQIIRLFDSIMRGYPIGTFFFWLVSSKTVSANNYAMYEFTCNYRDGMNNQLVSADKISSDRNAENRYIPPYSTASSDSLQFISGCTEASLGSRARRMPTAIILQRSYISICTATATAAGRISVEAMPKQITIFALQTTAS